MLGNGDECCTGACWQKLFCDFVQGLLWAAIISVLLILLLPMAIFRLIVALTTKVDDNASAVSLSGLEFVDFSLGVFVYMLYYLVLITDPISDGDQIRVIRDRCTVFDFDVGLMEELEDWNLIIQITGGASAGLFVLGFLISFVQDDEYFGYRIPHIFNTRWLLLFYGLMLLVTFGLEVRRQVLTLDFSREVEDSNCACFTTLLGSQIDLTVFIVTFVVELVQTGKFAWDLSQGH